MSAEERVSGLFRIKRMIDQLIDCELLAAMDEPPADIDERTAQVEDALIDEFCAVLDLEVEDEHFGEEIGEDQPA